MRRRLTCMALALAALVAAVVLVAGGYMLYVFLGSTGYITYWIYEYFPDLAGAGPSGFSPGPNNTVYIADTTTSCFWVLDPATDQVVDRIRAPKANVARVARQMPGTVEYGPGQVPVIKSANGKRYRIERELVGSNYLTRVDVYLPGKQQPSGSLDFGSPEPAVDSDDVLMALATPTKLYVLIGYRSTLAWSEGYRVTPARGGDREKGIYLYAVDTTTDQVTHREMLWSPGRFGNLRMYASPFGKTYVIHTESAEVKIINSTTDEVKTITLSSLTTPARSWGSPTP